MEAFAVTELSLYWALGYYSGASKRACKALFERTTVDGAIRILTGICRDDTAVPEWPVMQVALRQLDEIRMLRNNLIHLGSAIEGDGARRIRGDKSSDAQRAVSRARVSGRLLYNVAHDLSTISLYLMVWVHPPNSKPKNAEAARSQADELQCSWLFSETVRASIRSGN